MSKAGNAVRVGAAAFALGLSLAGPQVVGVASADGSDTDSTASASPTSRPARGAASPKLAPRPERGPKPAAVSRPADRDTLPAAAVEPIDDNPTPAAASEAKVAPIPAMPTNSTIRRQSRLLAPLTALAPVSPRPSAATAPTSIAAAPTVASPSTPPAATAAPTGVLVQINAAVTNWFDASANWLAGLPANPVSELLQGALLLVRRSLFNQIPTIDPVQLKAMVNGQILGTLGAIDPEGDTLSYILTGIPQAGVISGIFRESAGTVQISPDGGYTYTPGVDFSGYDNFTVTVNDGGFNILDPFGSWRPAQAVVSVGVPPSPPDGASAKAAINRSLTIYNLTGSSLTLSSASASRTITNAAPVGTVLQPGETTIVTLAQYVFVNNRSAFVFTPTTDSATQPFTTYFDLEPFATNWGCSSSGSNCETSGSTTSGTAILVLLDAPGTVIRVPSGQGQRQSDVLNQLCGSNVATCSFQPKATGSYFGDWRLASDSVSNKTSSPLTTTITVTTSTSTTDTLKLKAGVKVKIWEVVEVAFEVEYNRAWTNTETFSQAITVTAQPGEKVSISTRNPTTRVNGDFTLVMRNTTWILSDVEFESPDSERRSEYIAFATPIPTGM